MVTRSKKEEAARALWPGDRKPVSSVLAIRLVSVAMGRFTAPACAPMAQGPVCARTFKARYTASAPSRHQRAPSCNGWTFWHVASGRARPRSTPCGSSICRQACLSRRDPPSVGPELATRLSRQFRTTAFS